MQQHREHESERIFANLSANFPGAIFQYTEEPDGSMRVRYMSPGCADVWGVTAEEAEQDPSLLWALIHPDDFAGMRASVTRSREELVPWSYVWRITTRSGQRKWLQGHGRPEQLEGGAVRWDTLILDISARYEADAARRQSEAKLSSFFAESGAGLAMFDSECRYTHVNPMLCKLNRLPAEEHIGKTPEELLGERASGVDALLQHVLDTGEGLPNLEAAYPDPEGAGSRHAQFSFFPLRDAEGLVIGVGAIATEITAQKQAEEAREELELQLAHAQRMESVGRLAGGVAHDFNNMLTVILGHCEFALEEDALPTAARHSLEQIMHAAERSAGMTGQLLAFARKHPARPEILDLNVAVKRATQFLRGLVGERIELRLVPGTGLGRVEIDAGQLDQVLTNLVVNARDAIRQSGTIEISTAQRDPALPLPPTAQHERYVALRVRDDGRGMDEATMANVFEPFFTTKEVGEGTGLGLAMLHGIVAQAGGFVEVESQEGEGTCFSIYLPEFHDGVAETGADADTEAESEAGTLLVVEDEPAILELTAAMLERQGFAVLRAQSPSQAMDLVEQHPELELVVTDMVMPEMEGPQLLQRLRERRPGLRALFVSGYSAPSAGGAPDAEAFLPKPFSSTQLVRKVQQLLAGR
jgi:two-component system cell cycle sensor histidine kinase/response regulator CckA